MWGHEKHTEEETHTHIIVTLMIQRRLNVKTVAVLVCELTADVGQAAAAVGSGGDQSLVLSADGDVGLTELRITLCNA